MLKAMEECPYVKVDDPLLQSALDYIAKYSITDLRDQWDENLEEYSDDMKNSRVALSQFNLSSFPNTVYKAKCGIMQIYLDSFDSALENRIEKVQENLRELKIQMAENAKDYWKCVELREKRKVVLDEHRKYCDVVESCGLESKEYLEQHWEVVHEETIAANLYSEIDAVYQDILRSAEYQRPLSHLMDKKRQLSKGNTSLKRRCRHAYPEGRELIRTLLELIKEEEVKWSRSLDLLHMMR
tara:strand:- start:31 stop:753 length:723 start_codon:yes stop_codon:yes gene_type:complete